MQTISNINELSDIIVGYVNDNKSKYGIAYSETFDSIKELIAGLESEYAALTEADGTQVDDIAKKVDYGTLVKPFKKGVVVKKKMKESYEDSVNTLAGDVISDLGIEPGSDEEEMLYSLYDEPEDDWGKIIKCYVCTNCGKEIKNADDFKGPEFIEGKGFIYKCPYCDEEFDDLENLMILEGENLNSLVEGADELTNDLRSCIVTLGDGISLLSYEGSDLRVRLEALYNNLLREAKKLGFVNDDTFNRFLFEDEEYNKKWVNYHMTNIGNDKINTALRKIRKFLPKDVDTSKFESILSDIESLLSKPLEEADKYLAHHYMCQDENGNGIKLFSTKYEAIKYAKEHPEITKVMITTQFDDGTEDVSNNAPEWTKLTPDVLEGMLDDLVQDGCFHNEDELAKGAGHVEYTPDDWSEGDLDGLKEYIQTVGATTEDGETFNYVVPNKKYGVNEINITFKPDGGLIVDNPDRNNYL